MWMGDADTNKLLEASWGKKTTISLAKMQRQTPCKPDICLQEGINTQGKEC